jgi:sporulation protein YlmC with PRC-barrel domain
MSMDRDIRIDRTDRTDDLIDRTDMDTSSEGRRHRRVLSASTVSGDKVRNAAGEDLGKIEDIMIDLQQGRVAYAVLSFGGFLGMGSKLFAVPWSALTVDEDRKEIILNVDKQTLENAPGFDKDNWPDMADPDWASQIHSHYGSRPYWEERDREQEREKTFRGGGGV